MMKHTNRSYFFMGIGMFLVLILFQSGCFIHPPAKTFNEPYVTVRYYPEDYLDQDPRVPRLDILRFHHTEECLECKLIGDALLKLLKEDFSEQTAEGRISYRAVNSEYFENKPLLMKYGVMEEDFVTHLLLEDRDFIQPHHELWLIAHNAEELETALQEIIESLLYQMQ